MPTLARAVRSVSTSALAEQPGFPHSGSLSGSQCRRISHLLGYVLQFTTFHPVGIRHSPPPHADYVTPKVIRGVSIPAIVKQRCMLNPTYVDTPKQHTPVCDR